MKTERGIVRIAFPYLFSLILMIHESTDDGVKRPALQSSSKLVHAPTTSNKQNEKK